jgi:hypothetical protein
MRPLNRRIVLCGLSSFAVALPSLGHGQSPPGHPGMRVLPPWRKIPSITIVAAENDFRTQFVREAIDYWNGQFRRMGSRFRLGSLTNMTGVLPVEDLKAFWEKQLTMTDVDLPVSVREVDGDVIVALSDGDFRAFSYRTQWSSKSLIAIPRLPEASLEILENRLGLARIVSHAIAHEFGHVQR